MFLKKIRTNFYIALLAVMLLPTLGSAVILPGLVDRAGNPVHSADEFNVNIVTSVTPNLRGYKYTYDLSSDLASVQSVWHFMLLLPDVTSVVVGTSTSIWGMGSEPVVGNSVMSSSVSWSVVPEAGNPLLFRPGTTLAGFSFISPYPPGIIEGYLEGMTNGPYFDEAPPYPPAEFSQKTPYGPGKIIPVIGPVKPAVAGGSNYTVLGCVGLSCNVQISALGPQDPVGTAYTYAWSGVFGTAQGAQPTVSLLGGATYPVTLTISDATGVLVTATQDIVVPRPQAVLTTPAQLAALTPTQLAAFAAALTPAELLALTPAQVAVLIGALTPPQVASLAPTQLTGLTPAQVNSVSALLTAIQLAGAGASHEADDEGEDDSDDDDEKSEHEDD